MTKIASRFAQEACLDSLETTTIYACPRCAARLLRPPPPFLRRVSYMYTRVTGQHVNKTDSAVRIIHIPTGVVATARNSRCQHRNRKEALFSLRRKIALHTHSPSPDVDTDAAAAASAAPGTTATTKAHRNRVFSGSSHEWKVGEEAAAAEEEEKEGEEGGGGGRETEEEDEEEDAKDTEEEEEEEEYSALKEEDAVGAAAGDDLAAAGNAASSGNGDSRDAEGHDDHDADYSNDDDDDDNNDYDPEGTAGGASSSLSPPAPPSSSASSSPSPPLSAREAARVAYVFQKNASKRDPRFYEGIRVVLQRLQTHGGALRCGGFVCVRRHCSRPSLMPASPLLPALSSFFVVFVSSWL